MEQRVRELSAGARIDGMTLRQAALTGGLAYLLNPVTFAEFYAMPHLIATDANQTVTNILAHPHLFASAVLAYFISLVGDIVVAWSLYVLLAPVNRALSLLAAWFQLVYAAMSLAAVANLGTLYRLLLVPDYNGQAPAGGMLLQAEAALASFRSGWGLGLILFGFHLVLLGVLIARSSYVPRWLGWFLVVDGAAWVVDRLSVYLYPNASLGFLNIFFTGELCLMVWLLGWGWRIEDPSSQCPDQ